LLQQGTTLTVTTYALQQFRSKHVGCSLITATDRRAVQSLERIRKSATGAELSSQLE
jgi:hypothetical protein